MKNQVVEINEAMHAGENVLKQIEIIQRKLSSAKTWGFIDLFSDGGLITAILKHSNLHDAQDYLDNLKELLVIFNNELSDIKIDKQIEDVAMSKGIEIADWLLDGFFVDIFTLSKISDSQYQMDDLKRNVERTLDNLYQIKNIYKEEL